MQATATAASLVPSGRDTPAVVLLDPLPIDAVLPEVIASLRRHPSLVLRAPTGAGKTTRVPPALLDAGFGRVLVLEPRRLAARAAARRIAHERRVRLGSEVGYNVRFDRQWGPDTRLLVVTPGVLLRMLHDDPFLEAADVVVFDEFHERGLDSDLALGMARLVQQTVRPELRIVAMSATLATEEVASYLGGCPVVVSEGRLFPVEIRYRGKRPEQPLPEAVAAAVVELLDETDGDLLVFLPGMSEIRNTMRELEPLSQERDLLLMPLHGDLPAEQQDAALLPQRQRKVVLATNVAETSVTVEGVTAVVDSGLARVLRFDPSVGLDRLELEPIAKASADQRTGRAGRTKPGVCVRLWSEISHRGRPDIIEPEVRRVDVTGAVLQLLALGETDVGRFPWLDAPRPGQTEAALDLLRRLGAVDKGAVTALGKEMARLPVHPRLGRLLVEGRQRGVGGRVALAAALLAERDPFSRLDGRDAGPRVATPSDVLDRVEALEEFERTGRTSFVCGTLHKGAARFVLQARDQLARLLGRGADKGTDEDLLRSLLAAFPDRLCRRREPTGRRGVMVGGRGVRLAPASGVDADLFLAVDVDAASVESFVRQASAARRDWLDPRLVTTTMEVAFDDETEKVTAWKRTRFEDLVLDETSATPSDAAEVTRVLAEAATARLDRVLPPDDSDGAAYLTRLRCLRAWMPEWNLPEIDNDALRDVVTALCHSCKSFADLRRADWAGAVAGRLTHQQRQAVEREAPERLQVPTENRLALRYEVGRPPVLAVRIQELFGLAETPRIAGGRVRVLLHLLGPNYRPQQVTDDLASFWANTYPQVRKDLRARYPKHAWPDDPLAAAPERRPRRKS